MPVYHKMIALQKVTKDPTGFLTKSWRSGHTVTYSDAEYRSTPESLICAFMAISVIALEDMSSSCCLLPPRVKVTQFHHVIIPQLPYNKELRCQSYETITGRNDI